MTKKVFTLFLGLAIVGLPSLHLFAPDHAQAAGTLTRISGANRIETAVTTSNDLFGDGAVSELVVATSKDWPDGITAGPLAAALGGPMLLNPTSTLSLEVAVEMIRVLDLVDDPEPDVYIVGGPAAINPSVVTAIESLHSNIDVAVIAGATRYETAVAVAETIDIAMGGIGVAAMLASGENFPDALTLSSPAVDAGVGPKIQPVLLTPTATLHSATASYLTVAGAGGLGTVHIGGGTAAVSSVAETQVDAIIGTVLRHAGANRYRTAQAIADYFYTGPMFVGIANGENFPDALVGGLHSGYMGQPFLLVTSSNIPPATADYIGTNKATLDAGNVYGGTTVIPESVKTSLEALM